ncbi:hypothetical protein LINGRAHAP2_LOCUS11540 [Linum grandiflorum]
MVQLTRQSGPCNRCFFRSRQTLMPRPSQSRVQDNGGG